MNTFLYPELKAVYESFKKTEDYADRLKQLPIASLNKEIIAQTLKSEPLTNNALTGFIQMFKYGCSDATFDRYLAINITDEKIQEEIIEKATQINQWGYTGAGLNSISNLTDDELQSTKEFLTQAFEIRTVEDAVVLCSAYDNKKVPYVTSGIYSPWLHYIQPDVFPILNNSHAPFRNWLGIAPDYPSCIRDFHELKSVLNENDLGIIDMFAHNLNKYHHIEEPTTIDLKGKRLFKISLGIFKKEKVFRVTGFYKVLEENNWIVIGSKTKKGQAKKFMEIAQIGDYVYLCYGGDSLICLAKIKSDSKPLDETSDEVINGENGWIYREVEPIVYPFNRSIKDLNKIKEGFMPSGYSTFYEVPTDKLKYINEKLFIPKFKLNIVNGSNNIPVTTENVESINPLKSMPLNTILFGPPGTGKTYNSIDKAVKIATGYSTEHAENKKNFDKLRDEGQIEFVTFHQNYAYEDFMVGIRPDAETVDLKFRPYKGIFYNLVDRAKQNYLASKGKRSLTKSFDDVFAEFIAPLDKGEEISVEMASKIFYKITDVENGTIRFSKQKGSNNHTLSVDTLKSIVEGKRDFQSGLGTYYKPLVNLLNNRLQQFDGTQEILKNYVLIIDEINRANMSRVFGELITLLEDDKRIDADNSLSITLPNGEKNFCIPPNLYIVGTMNTADKSIALIDIALRRRFEFEGFYPNSDILKEKYEDRITLLEKLNTAVFDKKKTADYLIGHGYFMKEESTIDILCKKIIPLLMEYFSGRVNEVEQIFESTDYIAKYNIVKYTWDVALKSKKLENESATT